MRNISSCEWKKVVSAFWTKLIYLLIMKMLAKTYKLSFRFVSELTVLLFFMKEIRHLKTKEKKFDHKMASPVKTIKPQIRLSFTDLHDDMVSRKGFWESLFSSNIEYTFFQIDY